MNWTAISKIWKKHDKKTGFCCRRKFLMNVLNKQPFTHYPGLTAMLEEVEQMYARIQVIREW